MQGGEGGAFGGVKRRTIGVFGDVDEGTVDGVDFVLVSVPVISVLEEDW